MRIATAFLLAWICFAQSDPWRIARYNGPSAHLADDLRAASIGRLLVMGADEPAPIAGITIVRAKAQALLALGKDVSGAVVLEGGMWPGLRSTIVLEQQRDVGFAAATSEPWITENGWLLLCARGIAPRAGLVLSYDRPKDALPKIGGTALALTEAAVFGGAFAVPVTVLADAGTPRARADRRRTIAACKFLADHPSWYSGAQEAAVAVLADNPEPVAEITNLLVRRNLPFEAFTHQRWPSNRPAVLVLVGQPGVAREDCAKVDSWRSAGTTVFERTPSPNPSDFAAEVREALGDRRPFRLSNAQQVIALLTTGSERVLHLLNYGIDPIQDVRVQLARPPARATLYSPEEPAGRPLQIRQGEITIPEMAAYCAVRLE